MPEEKTNHFLRRIGSPRIRVGARRAASRPRVGGAVDIPMLYDFASARVGMGRTTVVMAFRYLPAMHGFLRARRTDGLFKNLTAIDAAWSRWSCGESEQRRPPSAPKRINIAP
jgi:hypothetical protein